MAHHKKTDTKLLPQETIPFPSAALSYADDYEVQIDEQQLNSIATPAFTTHRNRLAEGLHELSQICLIPWRKSLQLIGSAFQSRPGANKEDVSILQSRPIRIMIGFIGLVGWLASVALAIVTSPIHLLALIGYKSRPAVSYIKANKVAQKTLAPAMTKDKPLHVRTHNVGFVLETMSITGDLRPVRDRAHELADAVLNDENQPDIIGFQETFHVDASRIFCDKLKDKYPYIISSVLPTVSGFNSGAMFVSKYPIVGVHFHCLKHNLGVERLAPKGILRVTIATENGHINIYNVHTQALLGKERAESRLKQLQQIKQIMQADFAKEGHPQLLMGDFNTSTLTAWGEDNIRDSNPEAATQKYLFDNFHDIFLQDHDRLTGKRKEGSAPRFLPADNKKMGLDEKPLPEPTGSWYIGPFATTTTFLASSVFKHKEKDRQEHKYEAPSVVPVDPAVAWGTTKWRQSQPANTARFDYVFFPKHKNDAKQDGKSSAEYVLNGVAEIRRVVVAEKAQSAPSDHLPVDVLVWRQVKISA